jgi:hypothetical protein
MAIQIISGVSNDVLTVDPTSLAMRASLYDTSGASMAKTRNTAFNKTAHGLLPLAGVNDGIYRPVRVDRFGNIGSTKLTPQISYPFYTAALPPDWNAFTGTMTVTHSLTSGTLLNASGIGTLNTSAALVSMRAVSKIQKGPLYSRHRARLIKGGTNGVGEIGLTTQTAASNAVPVNGLVFLYGIDGTLKPTVYMNSSVIAQGVDFASSIDNAKYYTWDIIFDDDEIQFIVQDPTNGTIVNQQDLMINALDPRFGMSVYWFQVARSYVGGTANVGAATQIYVADCSVKTVDIDAGKPWSHAVTHLGYNILVNPTVARAQLANYTNLAAPASATLSNTGAGYTTLGGQYQFAAVAGSETDYALFAFTVPTGVNLNVTNIYIDTINTGAAVATSAHVLQWFCGEATAVTLASNSFKTPLGIQVFPIGAAVAAQATGISRTFDSPIFVASGRIFHVGLKMPIATATASQIIRGVVSVNGYFD